MEKNPMILKYALALALSASYAMASAPGAAIMGFVPGLKSVATALGYVLMMVMGVKWIVQESPNDRAEAKKGMMYIVVGLLLVASVDSLVQLANPVSGYP
jgi:putative Mn2+ efflux pump MntP